MKKRARQKYLCLETAGCLLAVAACQNAPITQEVESSIISYLAEQEGQDVAEVIYAMQSIDNSREAVIEESRSIEESIASSIIASSIEESIYESMSIEHSIEESMSIEASIAESASIEESVAESASIEESIEESMSVEASIAESVSIEVSIAESVSIEASIAESMSVAAALEASRVQLEAELAAAQSVAESLAALSGTTAASGVVSGTVLSAGNVVNATMNDVPMIRRLFADTVVIGDSRAKGIVDCGVLTENEVAYYGGASVGTLYETTARGAAMMRSKALFIVGLNDLGWYHANASAFKADLINLIASYLAVNPNCRIYLQEILPVQEYGRSIWVKMDYIPVYNAAIQEVCAEYGYTFVSANAYALPEYVNSNDGAHFGQQFYLLWAQTIANQMGLWEDLQ